MGEGATEVTQVRLPPASAEEIKMNKMFTQGIMPAMMQQSGYETTFEQKDWRDYPEYADIKKARDAAESPVVARGQMAGAVQEEMIKQVEERENELKERAANESSFSMRKLASPRVEAIRKRHGEGSGFYKDALRDYEEQLIETDETQRQNQQLFLEKTQKFLRGDFSVTEEQRALIEKNLKPQRLALNKMYDEMEELTDENVQNVMDKYKTAAAEVDMGFAEVLSAMGEQIDQGEEDLNVALERTIKTRQEIMKMGIEDATGEITKKVAGNAAAMGRDPSDPAYQQQVQQSVAREIQRGELALGEMEAQAKLGIVGQAGERRLGLAGQRLSMAQERGRERLGLETGLERERSQRMLGIAEARGTQLTGLEREAARLRFQVGGGMAPSQLQAGAGSIQLQQALQQQRMANLGGMGQAQGGFMGRQTQLRMAQPTTTTELSKKFSWRDFMELTSKAMKMGTSAMGGGMGG